MMSNNTERVPVSPEHARGFCESEGEELSLSLARFKTRSYGSTARAAAPLTDNAERVTVQHRVTPADTLQGLALRYGVTMEQIKRANKLFSNDCIFLRHSLSIPVRTERPSRFNGLSLESPEGEGEVLQEPPFHSHEEEQEEDPQDPQENPSAMDPMSKPPKPEELSAKDYLHMLDLQIKRSKQAARKLKEDDSREDEDPTHPTSSYQEI